MSRELEDVIKLLEYYGLSSADIKVYFSILKRPNATIDDIRADTGLDEDQVSSSVNRLLSLKLVDFGSYPNRFEVVDPQKSLHWLERVKIESLNKEIEKIKETTKKVLSSLAKLYAEHRLGLKMEELTIPLADFNEMEIRTLNMIESAKKEVLIFTASFGWYHKVAEALTSAMGRNVSVRVLMDASTAESRKIALELLRNGISVRTHRAENYPLRGTIVDSSELIFLIWATSKKVEKPLFYSPSYSKNPGLVMVFRDAFETWWNKAKEIELL